MPTRQAKQPVPDSADATVDSTAPPAAVAAPDLGRGETAAPANAGVAASSGPAAAGSTRPAVAIAQPQPIPGATLVGHGIYLRPRQPYQLKASLFEFVEKNSAIFTSREIGETYTVPEQFMVNDSPPVPADQSLGETVIEESWDRFGSELKLNVSATVGNGVFSIDPSAFRAADLHSKEDSYYALRSTFIPLWNLSMIDVPDVPELEREVDALPHDPLEPSNRAAYARIFEKYGSHFVKSVWVGGKASLVFVVAKSSRVTKEEIRAGIQASFSIMKSSASSEQVTVSDKFKSSSSCKVFGSGGERIKLAKLSSLEATAYDAWIESIKGNPQAIQLGLVGIWTLVKNPAKAEVLKTAYIQETDFKPLTAIIPVTMTFEVASPAESRLYFVKEDDVFEYRLRQSSGQCRTRRNPEFIEGLRQRLQASPTLAKFCRPDAAMSLGGFPGPLNDALYLFKHRECLRLDVQALAIADGYPKQIEEEWSGVEFDRIDAVLAIAPDSVYFFRGPNYIRVDYTRVDNDKGEPSVGSGDVVTSVGSGDFITSVGSRDLIKKRWDGVTFDRLDTAVYWGNSKVYLFFGDQYNRNDMAVYKADPGYPRFIESNYVEDWELFD
jgi:MAC/Perforin domain